MGVLRQADTIAAGQFRGIKRIVGGSDQFIAAGSVGSECGHSGTDRHGARHSRKLPGLHQAPQLFGDGLRLLRTRKSGSDWPKFLGPTADSISPEKGLVTPWPKAGPRLVWEKKLDSGYGPPTGTQQDRQEQLNSASSNGF